MITLRTGICDFRCWRKHQRRRSSWHDRVWRPSNDQCWRIDGEDWWRRVDRFGLWHCDIKWCLQYPHGKRWHRWPSGSLTLLTGDSTKGLSGWMALRTGAGVKGASGSVSVMVGVGAKTTGGRVTVSAGETAETTGGRFRLFLGLAVLHQAVRLVSKHRRAGLQEHLELWCFRPG